MKTDLNQRQAEAVLEFQSDLLVTAGAGTGKTRVLTSKYLRLLEERRAGVAEIVAITFTKKAAAEMRERIRRGIDGHLAVTRSQVGGSKGASGEERRFWETQSLLLEKARIGTFHSFCLGLIREYPLEIGIPPVAGVFGEGEETIYLNQAIETALSEVLISNPNPGPERELILQLLLEFGWESFQSSLGMAYQTIRESGIPFATVISSSVERLRKTAGSVMTVEDLIMAIERLLRDTRVSGATERTKEIIGSLGDNWNVYRESLISGNICDDLLPVLNELTGALPRNLSNPIKEQVCVIRDQIEVLIQGLADQLIIPRITAIGTLLNKVDQAYTRLKKEQGYLDFTDQLILARNLLAERPRILKEIRQGIRYLLVDEFQDTNGLQMELITMLVGNDSPGGRLMAVGDIKQSIYRFRGAESDLILKLAARVKDQKGKIIPLTQNYRSQPRVIQFVNGVFARLFATEPFEYEPLEAALTEGYSGIEFILTGAGERNVEAQMVAQRIQQLIGENHGRETPLNYSDIVILFRAKTAIPIFQKALQAAGIPYYNCSGSGFYQCPEILDQLNLLRLTQQRYDEAALLNLLASPYVALSDESLLWLGEGEALVERFYKLKEFPSKISPPERQRLYRFRDLINELQEKRETLDIPSILRLAIQRGNYRELLWAFPDAGQRIANLEKLLAKADEFVAGGFHDLHRFLSYIEKLDSVAVLEGEAPTQSEAENVVRLMTIHRAKGLEFPVVFLPDLDRRFTLSDRRKIFFHKEVGLGFGVVAGDGETIYPSITQEIKERHRREEISELKRVLYVGLTRAKEQLILVGSGCNKSKAKEIETADNWMKWFELLIALPEDPAVESQPVNAQIQDRVITFQGIPIRIIRRLPELKKQEPEADLLAGYLQSGLIGTSSPAHFDARASEVLGEVAAARFSDPNRNQSAGPETGRRNARVLKVSEVLDFFTCGRYYFWRHQRQVAEPEPVFPSRDNDPARDGLAGAEPGIGTRIGLFVHQLARARFLDSDWPEALWTSSFSDVSAGLAERIKDDLKLIWRNLTQNTLIKESRRTWDEVPFVIKLESDLSITGRFDRLVETASGQLALLDYKTHRISGSQVAGVAEQYFRQLQLYSLAVKALWGRLPDQALLFFVYANELVPVPLEERTLAATTEEILKMGRFIAAHDEFRDYPQSGDCAACGYREWCGK